MTTLSAASTASMRSTARRVFDQSLSLPTTVAGKNVLAAETERASTTSLYVAAQFGHAAVVETFIRALLRPLLENLDELVKLETSETETTPAYVAAAAEAAVTAQAAMSPSLVIAATSNHVDVVACLLGGAVVSNESVFKALFASSELGHVGVVDALLVHAGANANLELVERCGLSALYYASRNGHCDVVERLLLSGVSAVDAGVCGAGCDCALRMSSLFAAVHGNHVRVVKCLVLDARMRINVDAADERGVTPLLLAAQLGGRLPIVRCLVEHGGADVSDRPFAGTPHRLLSATTTDAKTRAYLRRCRRARACAEPTCTRRATTTTARFFKCARCRTTYYCDSTCQRTDYARHRETCT